MKGEQNRTVIICVDSYHDQIPAGRFQFASDRQMQSFRGLMPLFQKINTALDQENFPQAYTQLRTFQDPRNLSRSACEAVSPAKGAAATFSVRFLFRQNATWQGCLTWLEGNQERYFRSALELILLLDNALGFASET